MKCVVTTCSARAWEWGKPPIFGPPGDEVPGVLCAEHWKALPWRYRAMIQGQWSIMRLSVGARNAWRREFRAAYQSRIAARSAL